MNNKKPYLDNIEKLTLENNNFRKVLFTGPHSQLVLMSLLPGEDIGTEVHHVDQFFRIEAGQGTATVDGVKYPLADGTALLVPAGCEHNLINDGANYSGAKEAMKLYTVYAPANHIDGRIHATKADAMADVEDEEAGPKNG